MSRRKLIILTLAALVLLFGVPWSLWYRLHHSMTVVRPFTSGDFSLQQHVLIATQGSQFKDTLVGDIVQHLATRSVYVQVIDISALPSVRENDWSAIVVLHTWQFGKPPAQASAFLDRIRDKYKVIVVTTSGSGREKLPNASTPSVPPRSSAMCRFASPRLRNGSTGCSRNPLGSTLIVPRSAQ